ncbi:MAG TPA: hypothetical protein VN372_09370 [Methanospirillum sp.]|nr:hypothetical protein [Methanospirillum sp.]
MKSEDIDYINSFTPEMINSSKDPEVLKKVLSFAKDLIIEEAQLRKQIMELEAEAKKLKRNQGMDFVKGKRQKPLNYVPGKDRI